MEADSPRYDLVSFFTAANPWALHKHRIKIWEPHLKSNKLESRKNAVKKNKEHCITWKMNCRQILWPLCNSICFSFLAYKLDSNYNLEVTTCNMIKQPSSPGRFFWTIALYSTFYIMKENQSKWDVCWQYLFIVQHIWGTSNQLRRQGSQLGIAFSFPIIAFQDYFEKISKKKICFCFHVKTKATRRIISTNCKCSYYLELSTWPSAFFPL